MEIERSSISYRTVRLQPGDKVLNEKRKELGLSYHEVRLQPGDPQEGPLGQEIVFVDDEGTAYRPGDEGYVEPEEGSAEFLSDQGVQLAEDQHRIATGQGQMMSPEQRENTQAEAERLTDSWSNPSVDNETRNKVNAVLQDPDAEVIPSDQNA